MFTPRDPLEPAACSVCGAAPPSAPAFGVAGFTIVRCPHCRVLRVSPRLSEADRRAYYDADYWRSRDAVCRGYADYAADEANIRRTFARRLRWIRRQSPARGRSLDIGCAGGFLVDEALRAGYDAFGLDWSEPALALAPPAVRPRLRSGTWPQLAAEFADFDLITLWDYLEHSPDPKAELSLAARHLKPGGWLSIIMPDAGSALARLLGRRWEEFKKPQEHLYFMTRRQLLGVLKELGFSLVARQWAGKYASLAFACSRFKPEDGWIYALARTAGAALTGLGLGQSVFYINPRDKMHLLVRKDLA